MIRSETWCFGVREKLPSARFPNCLYELRHSPVLSGGATRVIAAKFRTGADKTFGSDDFKTNLIGVSNASQLASQALSSLNVATRHEFLDVLGG